MRQAGWVLVGAAVLAVAEAGLGGVQHRHQQQTQARKKLTTPALQPGQHRLGQVTRGRRAGHPQQPAAGGMTCQQQLAAERQAGHQR